MKFSYKKQFILSLAGEIFISERYLRDRKTAAVQVGQNAFFLNLKR